jgi:hypothetical protein
MTDTCGDERRDLQPLWSRRIHDYREWRVGSHHQQRRIRDIVLESSSVVGRSSGPIFAYQLGVAYENHPYEALPGLTTGALAVLFSANEALQVPTTGALVAASSVNEVTKLSHSWSQSLAWFPATSTSL